MAGNLLLCVHRAQNTADLASVAAAQSLRDGAADPCAAASRTTSGNGTRLESCAIEGEDAVVAVQAATQVRSHRGSSGSHVRGLLPVIRRLPDSRCMTARNVQLKVMGNLALDVKHGYRTSMSKTSHANTTVAVVCNPTSNKGKAPKWAVMSLICCAEPDASMAST